MKYDFAERLEFSLGENVTQDEQIISKIFSGCIKVEKTNTSTDKSGIDYIAHLFGGGKIKIDVKTRDRGASKYWKQGEPELALEIWSVCPQNGQAGKRGWTLSDSTQVDYILFKFHEQDSSKVYMLPYQQLRQAFIKNGHEWIKLYGRKKQSSGDWHSEAIFVPASQVLKGILNEMEQIFCINPIECSA